MISMLIEIMWELPLLQLIVICILDDLILLIRLWPFYLGIAAYFICRKLYRSYKIKRDFNVKDRKIINKMFSRRDNKNVNDKNTNDNT